jgi:Mrp family chromosome partitioning ATPase
VSTSTPGKDLHNFIQYTEIKNLLDRLLLLQETEKFHSLAVLSEFDGEGKTFVAAALAVAYTERLKRKVLIVDTTTPRQLHLPVSAKTRKKSELLGELLEEAEQVDVISLSEWSGMKSHGNADEYQIKKLFAQIATQYSLILVDTSSLSRRNRNNFNPVLIARQCDASILISARSEIAPAISEEHKNNIVNSHVKLIGMIHNQHEIVNAAQPLESITHGKQ